jgi:hypothetical protein
MMPLTWRVWQPADSTIVQPLHKLLLRKIISLYCDFQHIIWSSDNILSSLLFSLGSNQRASMRRYRSRREARGSSQVDTQRTRGSGTRCCLPLAVPVRHLVGPRHHVLLLLLTRRGGRRHGTPAAAAPAPPPPLRWLLICIGRWRACSLVNRVHPPLTVTRHLCSITCN